MPRPGQLAHRLLPPGLPNLPRACPQLQITVTNNSPAKQVFLRLLGERSLTARPQGLPGGRLTVLDRSAAVVASVADGILWDRARAEKLLISPTPDEWDALALKAGTP